MNRKQLKEFLDEKYIEFNRPFFIESDPISIPHRFSNKEDIEISAFLTSLIAWGRRDLILRSAGKMMELMNHQPFLFVKDADKKDFADVSDFVHRTFNGQDFGAMLKFLQFIYQKKGGLENVFSDAMQDQHSNAYSGISTLRNLALEQDFFPHRTRKHLPDPESGSSAKRMNMFLRWMVRRDKKGVDFGIWSTIDPAKLICPLDIHTGRVARNLGLLRRKQDDRRAAEELMTVLRKFDPVDPAKYDFALFGLGVFDGFR